MSPEPPLDARVLLARSRAADPGSAWRGASPEERAAAARTARTLAALGVRAVARGEEG